MIYTSYGAKVKILSNVVEGVRDDEEGWVRIECEEDDGKKWERDYHVSMLKADDGEEEIKRAIEAVRYGGIK